MNLKYTSKLLTVLLISLLLFSCSDEGSSNVSDREDGSESVEVGDIEDTRSRDVRIENADNDNVGAGEVVEESNDVNIGNIDDEPEDSSNTFENINAETGTESGENAEAGVNNIGGTLDGGDELE